MSTPSYSCEEALIACANLDPSAPWVDFISCFNEEIKKTVYRQARRCGNTNMDLVNELVQEVYLRLSSPEHRVLAKFKPRRSGSAHAYIHVVAKNFVTDYFKSLHAEKHGGKIMFLSAEETDAIAPDGKLGTPSALERHVLLAQINECLNMLERDPAWARDCQIFWYYYKKGLSAQEIAQKKSIGLTAKGVESALSRLVQRVRELIVKNEIGQTGAAG